MRKCIVVGLLILGALMSRARADGTVNLAWDPNTEPDLAGYRMHYGSSSRNYTNVINVGDVTTNTIPALINGVTYYFAVTAYNTEGLESAFSNEINFTPAATNQVNVSNTPPLISPIPAQTIQKNTSTAPIPFTIGDAETGPSNLANSSSTNLVPSSQIVLGGSGANRTITINPGRGKIGTTYVTVQVSDGALQASSIFLLTVSGIGSTATYSVPAATMAPTTSSIVFDPVEGTTIEWTSALGASYHLLAKDDVNEPGWRDLSGSIVGEGQTTSWIDGTAQGKLSRFYLILAQ